MELTLIFPHQLFADHPCLKSGRSVALIEDPLFFGTDPQWPMQVHRQRALLHRASMAAYADTLRERGFKVVHQRHHQARDTHGHLQALVEQGFRSFHLADPIDDLLSKRLQSFVASHSCALEVSATPMLLTPEAVVEEHFNNGRKPFMAKFYEMQRRRLGVLMDGDGNPVGGRWSFDADNRKKLPKGIVVPAEPDIGSDSRVDLAREQLEAEQLPLIGSWTRFAYPLDHQQADRWLQIVSGCQLQAIRGL